MEQFRLIVEQLEVSRQLILSKSLFKARMAIILLDNIADVLLYRRTSEMFADDDFAKKVLPQQFPRQLRKEAWKNFHIRLGLEKSDRPILPTDSVILGIGHRYRNAAYHKDEHNPAVTTMLARIIFT